MEAHYQHINVTSTDGHNPTLQPQGAGLATTIIHISNIATTILHISNIATTIIHISNIATTGRTSNHYNSHIQH
jgi:hypothetical protein